MDMNKIGLFAMTALIVDIMSFSGCTPKQGEVDITPPKGSADAGANNNVSGNPFNTAGMPATGGGASQTQGTVTITVALTFTGETTPYANGDIVAKSISCDASCAWTPSFSLSGANDSKATATFVGQMPPGPLNCTAVTLAIKGANDLNVPIALNQTVTFDGLGTAAFKTPATVNVGPQNTPAKGGNTAISGGSTPAPTGGGTAIPKVTARASVNAIPCTAGMQPVLDYVCKNSQTEGQVTP